MLVTDLVTAALIQLVVGHQDEADLRKSVGSLAGVVVVIDTPVALLLLAEPEVVANTERVLQQASACGVDLRFPPSLTSEISSCVRYVADSALRDKVDDRFHFEDLGMILDVIEGNDILNSYVRGRWAGRYENWSAFEEAASELINRLRRLGARGLHFPAEDAPDVVEFLVEHNKTIVRRNLKEPGTRSAKADARLMACLCRARKKPLGGVWPAAWLLSPDTHVPETYRTITCDPEPVTVTLGQLGALLLRFTDVKKQIVLARAASGSLRRDAVFATAARVSPAVVDRLVEIASNREISAIDHKRIRRGVAGVLEHAGDEVNLEAVIAEVTNSVLAEAGSRVRRRYEDAIHASETRAEAADSVAKQAQRGAAEAELAAGKAAELAKEKQQAAQEADASFEREKALRVRDGVLLIAAFACVTAANIVGYWSIAGVGGVAIWQAWVVWGDHIRVGKGRPRWAAILLAAVFAGLAVRDLFGL